MQSKRQKLSKPPPVMAFGLLTMLCLDIVLAYPGIFLASEPHTDQAAQKAPALPNINNVGFSQPVILANASSEAITRPLFWPSRRPFEPAVILEGAQTPPALPPTMDQVLIGVFIDGSQRRALLRRPNDAEGIWLNEGDTIDGWRIADVTPEHATLEAAEVVVILKLYPDSDPSAH
ncbi:hypothetical protein HFO02_36020 [Rhizobium laguerreae]|uniref:hypothetical protein n=1 Tax=Rhizobium laguerreae TaxID=1076926 RepID=UPI001C91EB0A|nr:hypothetical protein [Rhizobium laguerreae]MBY3328887.1 hypothetical protein [Rhizobium laguerreae]